MRNTAGPVSDQSRESIELTRVLDAPHPALQSDDLYGSKLQLLDNYSLLGKVHMYIMDGKLSGEEMVR